MKCTCGNELSACQRFCTVCGQPLSVKLPLVQMGSSQKDPDTPGLYYEALENYKQGRYLKAEKAILELLLKFPKVAKYQNFIGSIYLKCEKLNLALLHFAKAVELEQESWEPYYNSGIVYYRQLETHRAKICFLKSYQINRQHFKSLYNLGTLYLKEGKYQEAVAAFSKVRELAPDYTKNNINLEVALKKQK